MHDDTLIYLGDAVKALGSGRVGGYVVRFGTPESADCQGDYFTAATDFGLDVSTKARVVYHHGLTRTHGARKLGVADLAVRDDGLWGEALIADPAVYARAEAGQLGWSSGSVERLVGRREVEGKAEVVAWPLIEVSLTPTPVDPRNRAVAIKSLHSEDIDPDAVAAEGLLDRSERLVADATELACLYAKALDQRAAEGRHLSPDKRAACKSLSDRFAAMATIPGARADPASVRALALRLLGDRIAKGDQP